MIAVLTAILLFLVGAGEIVFGVFVLAGQGWGFIALGAFTIGGGLIAARSLG
jgi:hypothetical protein